MSFNFLFYRLISRYFSPFKNLTEINEICKSGFQKRKIFYYSILIYLLGTSSLLISKWFVKGINVNISIFGVFIFYLLVQTLLDFLYIFISLGFVHLLKAKADFETFSTLYFVSNYFYLILIPLVILFNFLLRDNNILSIIVIFIFSIYNLIMKIKVFSLSTKKTKEEGFLYFIIPFIFICILILLILFFSVIELVNIFG